MNNSPIVSVIIPTYREWYLLKNCLEALSKQTYPTERVEILVINNDPNSPPPSDFRTAQNVQILSESQPGSYAARNLGLRHSSGNYIAFTDSDCLPLPNWLEEGVKLLEKGYDLVGGKMEFFKPNGGDHKSYLFESRFSFRQDRNVLQNKQSITANLFVKCEVFEHVGVFDSNLLSGGDYEWTKRATDAGHSIAYGENVLVKHPSRKDFQALVSKKQRTSGGMYHSFFKSYSPLRKLGFTLWILRPPLTIFGFKGLNWKEKIILFQARWYLEWIGVREMVQIHLGKKGAIRE
jgi:glycosyltransferase involved in cell wall biosynthesis